VATPELHNHTFMIKPETHFQHILSRGRLVVAQPLHAPATIIMEVHENKERIFHMSL